MDNKKAEFIIPSLEEDVIINAQIAADPDDCEWDEECFAIALTTEELLAQYTHLARLPQFAKFSRNALASEPVNVGIDSDIAKHFQKSGEGWEGRLNQALRSIVFGRSELEK